MKMMEQYKIVSNGSAEEVQKTVNELMYFSKEKWVPLGGLTVQPNGLLLQPMVMVKQNS